MAAELHRMERIRQRLISPELSDRHAAMKSSPVGVGPESDGAEASTLLPVGGGAGGPTSQERRLSRAEAIWLGVESPSGGVPQLTPVRAETGDSPSPSAQATTERRNFRRQMLLEPSPVTPPPKPSPSYSPAKGPRSSQIWESLMEKVRHNPTAHPGLLTPTLDGKELQRRQEIDRSESPIKQLSRLRRLQAWE